MPTPEGQASHPRPAGSSHSQAFAWFGELSQSDFEIEFFDRVVERNPKYVLVLRCLGELLARKGLYDRSLQIDRRLVALLPGDCVARYNLACSLARGGSRRQAIEELARAIEHGYDDFGHLEVDPDLDSIRGEPAYKALMRRHGIKN